jgi:hypothetical protein
MPITQGSPLPNITTTQTQNTNAPSWYTEHLSNLASESAAAARNAQFIGATPLQEQAFQRVSQNVGAYQPTLTAATNMVTAAGNTTAPDVISNYMSPYTSQVVNQIGALGQRGIQQNLAPGATAGAVGSGQFGSKRGAEVLGQTIRDANQNILATQGQALNTGYQNAMQAAQQDLSRQLGAGQQLGALAQQTQTQGLADINALATLGAQQQQIAQNKELFPLQTLGLSAQNLRGYSIPTSVSSSYTGPIPGAYAASPLQQIAGLASLAAGISNTPLGTSISNYASRVIDRMGGVAPNTAAGSGVTEITNTAQEGQTGYGWRYFSDGTAIDPRGNYYYNGSLVYVDPQNTASLEGDIYTGSSQGGGSLGDESDL